MTSSTASTVSVPQALAILDGPFEGLADGIADAGYAFWLGSGISWSRVDGLRNVVRRVLEFLRAHIDPSDPACPFRRALAEMLDLSRLNAAERATIDFGNPVNSWPKEAALVEDLVYRYSEMLDVQVDGKPDDYLLWDAVDVVGTYASGMIDPDAEHLCIAVLMAEGVAPEVATANWDGLIERAVEKLGLDAAGLLRICVANADFQAPSSRSTLFKFHGCAVRAANQPDPFRKMLIARQSQVTRWPHELNFASMHAALVALAANRRTLMIGLSAQDSDIQDVFAAATAFGSWAWNDPRPPHAFAEEELGPRQINILRVVYADDYGANRDAIYARSRVRAYAKTLLVALVLDVLSRKLCAYARAVDTSIPDLDMAGLCAGVIVLRDAVAASCGPDQLAFVHHLLTMITKVGSVFDTGAAIAAPPWRYRPIGALPVHQTQTDPALESGGVRELAALIGLLGRGQSTGAWQVGFYRGASVPDGALEVSSSLGDTRLYLCANGEAGARLIESGVVDVSSNDVVIVYSRDDPRARPRRSPRAAPGRTGRSGLREIGMARILRESSTIRELDDRFRKAVVL